MELLRALHLCIHEACPFVQVFCNGEEVLTVSGTKEKYVVDVWSGNHPFYLVRSCADFIQLECLLCGKLAGSAKTSNTVNMYIYGQILKCAEE